MGAPRLSTRALRRAVAVLGLVCSGFFGVGVAGASAQTLCIGIVCTPPPPTALPSPVPTPTISVPLPISTPTLTVPTLPPVLDTPTAVAVATPTVSLPALPGQTTQGTPTPTGGGGGGALDGVLSQQQQGQTCTVNLAGLCVLPSSSACPVGSTDPACIVQTPGSGGTPGGGGGGGGGGHQGSGGGGGTGGGGSSSPQSVGTFSPFAGGSLTAGDPATGAGAAIPLGLSVASIPPVQQLSPVSGLQFGHALILWPLFGLLDLLGLAAVYLVVRRFRATRSD